MKVYPFIRKDSKRQIATSVRDILKVNSSIKLLKLAGPTRLELATSCVTGMRSNQLNYDPIEFDLMSNKLLMSLFVIELITTKMIPKLLNLCMHSIYMSNKE